VPAVEHAIAGAPLGGQAPSGDRAFFATFEHGALVAVIDGLGHGIEASAAADAAMQVLAAEPTAPLELLVDRCNERLRATRGVAMSLAVFDTRTAHMTWLGIGNVEGVLARAPTAGPARDEALTCRGGIVGYRLPSLSPRTLDVHPGDTLVFASDGIRPGFRAEIASVREPCDIAHHIVERWATGKDDACVAVARYRGEPAAGTRVDIDDETAVSQARMRVRELARACGFVSADVEALATAVSELAHNLLDHAGGGQIGFARLRDGKRGGLAVIVRDRGPGIADVALALQDGYSTGRGLGCGLPGARRLVDDLRVETEVGVGTVVTLTKWLR
jgi:negative regulator of sigma-B (phosphoserine phosphatase)